MILRTGSASKSLRANFPRRTWSRLFTLQQAGFHQPFDRAMTDAAYSRRFAQTNSLRIRQGSFLTDNGMVAPGGRHANLIPSLPFARGIAAVGSIPRQSGRRRGEQPYDE